LFFYSIKVCTIEIKIRIIAIICTFVFLKYTNLEMFIARKNMENIRNVIKC